MKRLLTTLLAAGFALTMCASTVFAVDSNIKLDDADGKLEITEDGSYILTGKLDGTVYVDPGEGDVELVLDGADINGADSPGIIAVSGDSLTITLPEGSVNRISGSGGNLYEATIYSTVDTTFEGDGALYVTGLAETAVKTENADLTFNVGSYAMTAEESALSTGDEEQGEITFNNGHFSIQAENAVAPDSTFEMNGGQFDEPFAEAMNGSQPNSQMPQMNGNQPNGQQPQMNGNQPNGQQPQMNGNLPNGQQPQMNDNQPNGQQPQMNGNLPNGQQPQMNGNQPNGQQPQMNGNQPNGQMPQVNGNQPNGQQPQMNGNQPNGQQPQMNGNQPNGQQPQMNGNNSTANSPSEIVYGNSGNSAASLEADYDSATYITVTDDESQIKITSSGTYVVSGSSSDGNITVKKGTTGVVLVLNNLDLTSTTGATVSVNKEAEVKVIIKGEVVLTDNENPEDEYSSDADTADAYDGAALKAKADSQVYVTGDGTLTINGNAKNGIKAGDNTNLVIDGVTVNINAANDGINGNYDVTLLSGTFNIAAGDDAIHADHILTIGSEDGTGPTVNVTKSGEGLEGTVVNILGGDVSIVSSDDAINAANGDGLYEDELDYSFNMLGGKVTVNSKGDGIDSNGDVNLIGGNAQINSASNGGEAGIDYDGQYYISNNYSLNNRSGVSGAEMMPGAMNGNQPNNQQPNGQQPNSQQPQQNGNMPNSNQNPFSNGGDFNFR